MTLQPAPEPEDPPAPPPPPWWRRWPAIATAAVLVLVIIGTMVGPQDQPEPQTTPTTVSPFDPAAWEAFVDDGYVPESISGLIRSVSWSGVALVAETSIYPDSDAPAAARGVCSALSAFWLQHGGFRPVQVLGSDGGVLVSRHALSDGCDWRR